MPLIRPGANNLLGEPGYELDLVLDAYADAIELVETAASDAQNDATAALAQSGVTSVAGRTGAVTLAVSDVSGAAATGDLAGKLDATASAVGGVVAGSSAKSFPVGADVLALSDSASSNVLKKLSWANLEASLIADGHATVTLDGAGGKINGLSALGTQYLLGPLVSGQWMTVASVNRLLLSGTGTITIDSRDRAGTVSPSVESYNVTGAVNQLEYPFFGEAAVQIRATLTGSATCEVI